MVLICLGSRYMASIIPLGVAFGYGVQKYYLMTSRQLRFLELEAKAPLFTAFVDMLSSLETVRAFGWQQMLQDEFFASLDLAQRPYYLLFCLQHWLAVVLDLFIAALAVVFVTLALEITEPETASYVGVALVNILGFNQTVTHLITSWTRLETSMGAIARLRNLTLHTPHETPEGMDAQVDVNWPTTGAVEIQSVTMSYGLSVRAGEHMFIRGRTGSGKSTLLNLLFRLFDPSAGQILIDGVDIRHVPPRLLRERIIGISQDVPSPVGTVQHYLDASELHTRAGLEQQLERFGLSSISLDAEMAALQLSTGQGQLLALVRAVLRRRANNTEGDQQIRGGLLLMDEPTSKLDYETEARALAILDEEFKDWTVIAIVHREHLLQAGTRVVTVEKVASE